MSDSRSNPPLVSIVMLHHTGIAVTRAAIESVEGQSYSNIRLHLIDNGSTEAGLQEAVAGKPLVVLHRSEINLGFAAGSNLGIKAALSSGTDYILLLNNDVILHPETISRLVRCAESDPLVGAVSPKIYFAEPRDRIWFSGGWFKPWAGFARMRGWGGKDCAVSSLCRETDWISGCAFLAKAHVVRKVGLLEERLGAENEDLEWSLRIREAGYRLLYCPEAVLWHLVGYTHSETGRDSARDRLCVRNLLLILRERLYWWQFLAALPTFGIVWLGIVPLRHALNGRYAMMSGPFLGVMDYLRLVLRTGRKPQPCNNPHRLEVEE